MSRVFMISDLHIGHVSILKFRRCNPEWTLEDHDKWIVKQWNSVVKKRDTVYVLGDVCFDVEKMKLFLKMNGNKILILGNHDKFDLGVYQKYFSKIHAFRRYKGYWISHCPIHPQEMRGRKNIHGHLHDNYVLLEDGSIDTNYFNVSVEKCNDGKPILFSEIVERTGGHIGG